MSHMFNGWNSLLSSFNTQIVNYMKHILDGCNSLTNLNFSFMNTQNANYMSIIIYGWKSLTNLNLSSFNSKILIKG